MMLAGFILLAVMALMAVLMPWPHRSHGPHGPHGSQGDQAQDALIVYKAQLADLDRDHSDGKLDKDGLAASRLEIQRRMLRLGSQAGAGDRAPGSKFGQLPRSFGVGVALTVLILSAGLYLLWGRPDIPAQPGQRTQILDQSITDGGPTYGAALDQIKAHLTDAPDDMKGWELLGKTAMGVGAYRDAAQAYRMRSRLDDPRGAWKIRELQAYLALGGGQVTPAAMLIAEELQAINPDHPAAAFYLGMGAIQSGDKARAYRVWKALLDRSPEGSPWYDQLMPQLKTLEKDLGLSPADSPQ